MVIGGTNVEKDDATLTHKNIGIVLHRYWYVIFIMTCI